MIKLGVEDRHSQALGREGVAIRMGDPDDEALEAESPQVIGHLRLAVGATEQTGHQGTKALVGEAVRTASDRCPDHQTLLHSMRPEHFSGPRPASLGG